MTFEELKESWDYNLSRYKKAEKLAEENPNLFDKYTSEFNRIVQNLSGLMLLYTEMTGAEMPEKILHEGFNL